MKRALIFLAILFLAACLAGPAFGAGASTAATYQFVRNGFVKVSIAITADDTDGSIDSITFSPTSSTAINKTIYSQILGSRLYDCNVYSNHGGTEVTDDTDIFVYAQVGDGTTAIDLLGGLGVDAVDSDDNPSIPGYYSSIGQPAKRPIVGPVTVTVTQPSGTETNDATLTVELTFEK